MNNKESLIKELLKAAKQTRNFGWGNYVLAYIFACVTVAGSIAATILAAVQVTPGWLTAIIAAIPAAVLAVSTTFNFEQKAIWHWTTAKRFEALRRKLLYENAEEAKVSEEFSKIALATFIGWTAYSSLLKDEESIEGREVKNQ